MEGFQIKDVADRLGIQPPSLFAHFDGRDDIVEAVIMHVLEDLDDLLPRAPDQDPVAALRQWIAGFVRYLAEHPAAARLILRDVGRLGSPGFDDRESTLTMGDAMEGRFAKLLRQGRRAGAFRKVRTEACLAQLVGAATVNMLWHTSEDGSPRGVSVKTLEREATELVLRYVSADLANGEKGPVS